MLRPETFTESHPASGGPARPGLTVTYNTDTLDTSFLQTVKAAGFNPSYDLEILVNT